VRFAADSQIGEVCRRFTDWYGLPQIHRLVRFAADSQVGEVCHRFTDWYGLPQIYRLVWFAADSQVGLKKLEVGRRGSFINYRLM
jgi:glutaredoxin-related protein